MFRNNFRCLPFYQGHKRGTEFQSNLNDLLSAMKAISPQVKQHNVITTQLLRELAVYFSDLIVNNHKDHIIDLIIIGDFFFALKFCKFYKSVEKGKTMIIYLGVVRFLMRRHKEIKHSDPDLLKNARFVWVLFKEQKKWEIFKSRTQQRTRNWQLCPICRFGRAVKRVSVYVLDTNKHTILCSVHCRPNYRSNFISNS